LLGIKRRSLWNISDEANARLDALMQSLEEPDDDAFFDHVRRFIETARAIAKLANDLRETREASQ
jgi:DNA-binding phage protein